MSKNLYDILEIDKNCSINDIKKAYRNMISIYHPDKYINNDLTYEEINERFISIQQAYEILIDNDKRLKYDSLDGYEQNDLYDKLKEYLKTYNINDGLINFIFDGQDKLRKYINNVDILGIYNELITKMDKINIEGKIYTTLYEKYNDKYRKIQIKRKTKHDIILFVPLRNTYYIGKDEGENDIFGGESGDVILEIITVPNNEKCIIKNNDIYITEYINLYNFLYGGSFDVNIFDNIINIKHDNFINTEPLIIVMNKGMIYDEVMRGNLYIKCEIKSLDKMKEQIYNIS